MRTSGYVKNINKFNDGCFSSDFAHVHVPNEEKWTYFEAVTTDRNSKTPTGYMAIAVVGRSLWLLPETYSESAQEALQIGSAMQMANPMIKGPIDTAVKVAVEFYE